MKYWLLRNNNSSIVVRAKSENKARTITSNLSYNQARNDSLNWANKNLTSCHEIIFKYRTNSIAKYYIRTNYFIFIDN